MSRHRRAARGQALVEMALVLPIFLLLLIGLVDVGRIVYANNAISQAAREGARWGSVNPPGENRRATDEPIRQTVLARISGVPSPVVGVACDRLGVATPISQCRTNDVLAVTVETDLGLIMPVLSQIFGPLSLEATSEVAVHQ